MFRIAVTTAVFLFALLAGPSQMVGSSAQAQDGAELQRLDRLMDLIDDDRYDEAVALSRDLSDPALRDLVQWRRLMREGTRVGFGELADFLETRGHWPSASTLARYAEAALPDWLGAQETVDWFRMNAPQTGDGALRFARALASLGLRDEGQEVARNAWHNLSLSASTESALLAEFPAAFTQDDIAARVERLLQNNDRSAVALAQRLGSEQAQLADARLRLATMQGGVDTAIEALPDHLRDTPGLTYERARWRLRSDADDGALELLDPAPPVSEVDADHWWRVKHWAARRALRQGQPAIAYRIASNHGAESGLTLAEGEFLAGWIALRFLNDPEQAYRHFDRLYHNVSMPISLGRGAYWAGEAAKAMGREDWATQWYRVAAQYDTVFYGQMAGLHLGHLPVGGLEAVVQVSESERQAFEERDLTRVTRALAAIDRRDLLSFFFLAQRSNATSAEDYYLAGRLALDLDYPDQAIRAGRMALTDGHQISALLYPPPPVDLSGDPDGPLLLGLMRQESGFDRNAVSSAGARGLMQLMPGTAEQVARRLGVNYSFDRLTTDPQYNITLGRDYLERMLDRYAGFLPLALAAYNAGPGRADQWIVEFGDPRHPSVDPIDWMEQIPFSETRNYVQRVLESYTVYQVRLRPDDNPFVALPRPTPVALHEIEPDPSESTLEN